MSKTESLVDQALKHEVAGMGHKYLDEANTIYAGLGGGHRFEGYICIVRIENPGFLDNNERPRHKFLIEDGTWSEFPIDKHTRQPIGWFKEAQEALNVLAMAGICITEKELMESAKYG